MTRSMLGNGLKDTTAKPLTINIVSLGCSKNLVDSERLMKQLSDVGFNVVFEKQPSTRSKIDIVVINTCGFIGDAKEQSINAILEWAQLREKNRLKGLYVMGCLSERHGDELRPEIPEVDEWFGKFNWSELAVKLAHAHPATLKYDRIITTPRHYTYIKISEGCDRFCAFCAIPLITGRHHSRPIDEIVDETRLMVSRGVKEFNVIAQDLSAYGRDFGDRRSHLAELIERMADVEGVKWIRLHYAYPADFPTDVLDVMASKPNVCRYLDIALQHGSDRMLERMRRHIDMKQTRELLNEIRRRVPGIHIRTTLMTGFPGETESDFTEMMDFVREQRFERMGAFAYCDEEGTFANRNYGDDIAPEVKQERLDRLMELQQTIALEINETKVGRRLNVIIDRKEGDSYFGRTEFDSPEVDPEVIMPADSVTLRRGDFAEVEITEAMPFELVGKVIRKINQGT